MPWRRRAVPGSGPCRRGCSAGCCASEVLWSEYCWPLADAPAAAATSLGGGRAFLLKFLRAVRSFGGLLVAADLARLMSPLSVMRSSCEPPCSMSWRVASAVRSAAFAAASGALASESSILIGVRRLDLLSYIDVDLGDDARQRRIGLKLPMGSTLPLVETELTGSDGLTAEATRTSTSRG